MKFITIREPSYEIYSSAIPGSGIRKYTCTGTGKYLGSIIRDNLSSTLIMPYLKKKKKNHKLLQVTYR